MIESVPGIYQYHWVVYLVLQFLQLSCITLHSKYKKINHKFVSSISYEWFILWIFVMISSIVYYIDNSLLLALIRLFKMEIEVKPKNIKLVFVASPLSIQQRLVGSESR